ncbi:MAG: pentapeptide repeat-containing protein [Cyanobacteria bacterium P01_A01_bin.135]
MKTLLTTVAATLVLNAPLASLAENPEQLQQLISTRRCSGCDLSHTSLVHTDLSGVEAQGSDFSFANLNRSRLTGANLQGADFSNAVLFNVDLSGTDLTGANLEGADLRSAYLYGAVLDGAQLRGANLQGAAGIPEALLTARSLYEWGQREAERGNFQDAYSYYTQAIEKEPNAPHLYLSRSVALYRWGYIERAIADADRAEQLFGSQGNEQAQQTAALFAENLMAQQEARAEAEGRGSSGFLNVFGAVASLLLRFGLPF